VGDRTPVGLLASMFVGPSVTSVVDPRVGVPLCGRPRGVVYASLGAHHTIIGSRGDRSPVWWRGVMLLGRGRLESLLGW
jgi:hypothetical protein